MSKKNTPLVQMSLNQALTLAQSVLDEQSRSPDDPKRKAAKVIRTFAWAIRADPPPTPDNSPSPPASRHPPLALHIEAIQQEIGRVIGNSTHAGNLALDAAYEATRLAWAITARPDDQHYIAEKAALTQQALTRLQAALTERQVQ